MYMHSSNGEEGEDEEKSYNDVSNRMKRKRKETGDKTPKLV